MNILGNGAAEIFGDTPTEKAAIRLLVGDTVNVAGLIAGASYLKHRAANSLNYGVGVTANVVDEKVGGTAKGDSIYKITDTNANSSLPIGDRTSRPTRTFHTNNTPTIINSREYSGHALDEMRTQGIMPSVVENTVANNQGALSSKVLNNVIHYDSINNISVVVDKISGRVVTASFGVIKP